MSTLIQNPGRIRDLSTAMAQGAITAEALVQRVDARGVVHGLGRVHAQFEAA